ncbi:tRNA (N6-isopentenyl adenosine(37)-C2)-methylthiotransferase MiaB [Luteithermobacter gelatinilyticus]|uniref:tRNA (N6-isopentenyl adenosine(37)-C2)-methylthiotransferase MiaB n=1 Tax=Luteithermobacter gelatinilyticus TaxID=2582913 RepID=UPI0011065A2D|nr:tRNA (N6-isopentenyl adenosine(37)-C2)-methylthiotransferase MiaB [Luteithermobacter gelatinilyticus]
MTKKLYIKTYGCQMNVYDTERMVDVMAPEGYQVTDKPDDADLVVLNTCHIREKAAEKVYSDIGRIRQMKEKHNREGRDMVLAVGGCVAQAEGGEIMKRAPAVDMVFGPQTYHRLPDMVNRAITAKAAGRKPRILDTDLSVDEKFDSLSRKQVERKSSAFLTVQEGCDKFCTYCVVPYTRGAEFSRSVEDVMNDARRLAEAGVVEVTLLGQNVNAYHGLTVSGEEWSLARLIRELAKDPGFRRIRYTTSHPADMSEDLIRVHAEVEECMPYLHLPVQAGSDRILKAMNRHHTAESYRRIIEELRRARPDIALSGDFIVGFPGETDAEFGETMHLVRDIGYAQAYSFKYSARPGTPAAVMDDQVPEDVKAARLAELQAELSRQQVAFNENTVGRVMPVLLERRGKETGQLVGRSPYMQAVHVTLPNKEDVAALFGQIVDVKILAAGPHSLKGEVVGPAQAGQPAA